MEQHLPAVFSEMEAVGAIPYNAAAAQALDVALSTPPYESPGPTRAELEDLLV